VTTSTVSHERSKVSVSQSGILGSKNTRGRAAYQDYQPGDHALRRVSRGRRSRNFAARCENLSWISGENTLEKSWLFENEAKRDIQDYGLLFWSRAGENCHYFKASLARLIEQGN
jgi:hypothetical protein